MMWCWRCGWKHLEWLGWHYTFWQNKLKCFHCRIDALDRKYGPSESATLFANARMGKFKGLYRSPKLTRWEFYRLIKSIK